MNTRKQCPVCKGPGRMAVTQVGREWIYGFLCIDSNCAKVTEDFGSLAVVR